MQLLHRPRTLGFHGKILGATALLLLGCTADILGEPTPPGAISPGVPGETPGGAGSAGVGPSGQACTSGAAPTLSARIRRLTRLELENTLADLLGDAARPLALELESDTLAIGYSTGDERGVSSNYVDSLKRVAEQAAADLSLASESAALTATCFSDETSSSGCAQKLIRDFGARAWRRPLETLEVEGLSKVYVAGRATVVGNEEAMTRAGLDYAARAILQSPEFIFRTELGAVGASGAKVALTPHETAAALAYSLLASPPDAELAQLAAQNALTTPEAVAAQGRRLLQAQPERFARQAERFVREWLGIDLASPSWNKDTKLYPQATASFKAGLDQDTQEYLRGWASSGSFSELLTKPPAALDATERAGVLTLPSFLGSRAHSDASSPVVRGTTVMRKLLCLEPPPVPAMVPPLPPADQSSAKTTRERFEQHTAIAFCSACHQMFDPMGFAFEHYDAVGAYRDDENGTPVDSSGAIVGTASSDAPVADAIELSSLLSASPEVHACFVRQTYRFTLGRTEAEAELCALDAQAKAFDAQDLNLRELMLALVTAPAALERVPLTPDP